MYRTDIKLKKTGGPKRPPVIRYLLFLYGSFFLVPAVENIDDVVVFVKAVKKRLQSEKKKSKEQDLSLSLFPEEVIEAAKAKPPTVEQVREEG